MPIPSSVVESYAQRTPPFGALGEFVYLRTYARWQPETQEREGWTTTLRRVVDHNIGLHQNHGLWEREDEMLFDAMWHMKVLPAGRSLWTSGTPILDRFGSAAFNCAFLVINRLSAFTELFYLLLVGSGVGFRILPADVSMLPSFRRVALSHLPYTRALSHLEHTNRIMHGETWEIVVGDSKEGWVEALTFYLEALTAPYPPVHILFNYNHVRPKGEILKTFGGRASGWEALRDLFADIDSKVLAHAPARLRPIDCLDIANLIGYYVVVGGVRRTSEIALFAVDDAEVLHAKTGIYDPTHANYGKTWRTMSNNSLVFISRPTYADLMALVPDIKAMGEPGFFNLTAAQARRADVEGMNPCGEILLVDRGVCNLCEVNLTAYVHHGRLNIPAFLHGVSLATRFALRQTNITLDMPAWDVVQKRDRLLGVSLMGAEDAFDAVGATWQERHRILSSGRTVAHTAARAYAHAMRVPEPLLVTTVKPGGTVPQLPTVSSGAHRSYAPTYIRRIRIAATDPLARVVKDMGYPVYPVAETMLPDAFAALSVAEQGAVLDRAPTWVVEFPVQTMATHAAGEETARQQFLRYVQYQQAWTDHNTSFTIQVGDDEWEDLMAAILEHWDSYVGVSFIAKGHGTYPLMPYEVCSADAYARRVAMIDSSVSVRTRLREVERNVFAATEIEDASCDTGVCPVR